MPGLTLTHRRLLPAITLIAGCVMVCLAAGCNSLHWQSPLASRFPDPKIDGVQGPAERFLRRNKGVKTESESDPASLKPIAGTEAYVAAEALYNEEKYAAAEKAFKHVAKKYEKSEIREDALFMEAEAAFRQKHYADCYDDLAVLLKDYPATRHLDTVSRRLFEIGGIWLNDPKIAQISEVQQTNLEQPGSRLPAEKKTEDKKQNPLALNFFNEEKPLFDPEGNAVAALRAIWVNDPTGPLADDALMLAASYYARRGAWVDADNYYSLLREQYPTSPYVESAFILGSHVKLMSYEGPNYDNKRLEDARQLKETTLRLYPNSPEKQRLEHELAAIHEAEVARTWELIVFYTKKKKPSAVALYCHILISRYPDSKYAPEARKILQDLGPAYASGQKFQVAPPVPPKATLLPPIPGLQRTTPPELKPVEESKSWFGGKRKETDTAPGSTPPQDFGDPMGPGPSLDDNSLRGPGRSMDGDLQEQSPGRNDSSGDPRLTQTAGSKMEDSP